MVKLAFEMVRSNGLHMDTAAAIGVEVPSSPRYLCGLITAVLQVIDIQKDLDVKH